MIIVFSEDRTVAVLPDIESVRRECEAVDVENGVYRFFDGSGRRLVPHWTSSVQRRSLLGIVESVSGGSFELKLDPQDDALGLEASLSEVVAIDPNPMFKTVADLVRHIAANRK